MPVEADDQVAQDQDEEFYRRVGNWLRSRRQRSGLSLAQVSAMSNLSQSYLSQVERGLINPSMKSLSRVCQALGTTVQAVMTSQTVESVSIVRAGEGHRFGEARLLSPGNRRLHPVEMGNLELIFGDSYSHQEEEWVYVLAGAVEVEIDERDRHVLRNGDSIYLGPLVKHRWRDAGAGDARLLMVSEATVNVS